MKTTAASRTSRFSTFESGVALIITLAALVLVTMAAVAFFSRATGNRLVESSRANQVQSAQLARTGVDYVATQFLSDIVANSTAVAVGNSTIYRPKNATNMVPSRSVHGDLANDPQFPNLVLQSHGGNSSADPAPNGRFIGTSAWNAPMLLGGDGFISNTTVPTWIYVNRDGSTSTTANATTTIGRFAFNAYKIGGLLDINAFGHGDSFSADNKMTKGSPISAVLDALPGISANATKSNDSPSWPPTWRMTGDWGAVTYNGTGNATDSYKYYSRTGWRIPFSQNGNPDRFFATRQDLIRYAKANPSTFTANGTKVPALQYLTHWARDIDLPTHEPASGRPKIQQNLASGGNDAFGMDDGLNPSLLTIKKFGGQPAITKRFPLSRLSLVSTPVPPAAPTASAADILKYFGLIWDPDKDPNDPDKPSNRWIYQPGVLPATDILPLSDLPADREPDFVELLKAAISVGSLGKQFGIPYPSDYSSLGFPAQKGGLDGSVNYQLIQIAANIIDQYDSDGYPTRIQFDGREFYGVEDLPRLHVALDRSFRVGKTTDDYVSEFRSPKAKENDKLEGNGNTVVGKTWNPLDMLLIVWMVQPQLWNPHDSGATPAPSPTPANFRIIAKSFTDLGVEGTWFWKAGPYEKDPPLISEIRDSTYFTNLKHIGGPDCTQDIRYDGTQYIFFTGNTTLFREPTYLSKVGYPPGSYSSGSPDNPDMQMSDPVAPNVPDTIVDVYFSTNQGSPVLDTTQSLGSSVSPKTAKALGFVVGYMPGQTGGPQWGAYQRPTGGPVSLELQYGQGGNWWTIDRQQVSLAPAGRNFGQEIYMATRVDPRSDRWGSFYLWAQGNANATLTPNDAYLVQYQYRNFSITSNPLPNVYSHLTKYSSVSSNSTTIAGGWTGVGATAAPGRLQRNSVASDPFRYTDPDGVQRRGGAAYATDTSSEGWPMNQNNSASRPVVLNRPFRSVAELGNVFRGTPWRNLDFMTPESGDRVLLDVFTCEEPPPDNLVGGRVNLNMVSKPVLTALIQGVGLVGGSTIDQTTAGNMADDYITFVSGAGSGQGYLKDRSEIVGRWVSGTSFDGPAQTMASRLSATQQPLPRNRDTIVASLADVGTVRTWNILIDVVAQSGTAANGPFIPQGESRAWECIAIDRFTARVLARSSENISN